MDEEQYNAAVKDEALRGLPSVDALLTAMDGLPHAVAVDAARAVLDRARAGVRAGSAVPPLEELKSEALTVAEGALAPSLVRVVNASGVVLQTNLGRAPLSERALRALREAGRGYTNLEFDLTRGERGSRHEHVRGLLARTTGAEDGLVVNNNAAALFMVLTVFASGREVVVSRGQAVEIGGGFRIPDVLRESGARLVEVGTTNRTYVRDYAAAIGTETAALLRVHRSNFRVTGFVTEPSVGELGALAHERGVLLVDDLGSGCLVATERFGLEHEPTVQESVAAGASLALFSGDKLLGGPQCGAIVGRADLVARLRAHPLARALRVDKLTIAALTATLLAYAEGHEAEEVPVWRMLAAPLPGVRRRARRWAQAAGDRGGLVRALTMVGGGSLPGSGVPTWCATIVPRGGAEAAARLLREAAPPIVGRVERGRVLLDPRTVEPRDDGLVAAAVRAMTESNGER
ncbi:MAG: L-seryl-tRNA(Sec) selenium transferase [Dehalococcoidia bacterium]|nr:L-seryl-tRNA(Sec) selenium transferase [Dehalococcoidia bacterium]